MVVSRASGGKDDGEVYGDRRGGGEREANGSHVGRMRAFGGRAFNEHLSFSEGDGARESNGENENINGDEASGNRGMGGGGKFGGGYGGRDVGVVVHQLLSLQDHPSIQLVVVVVLLLFRTL